MSATTDARKLRNTPFDSYWSIYPHILQDISTKITTFKYLLIETVLFRRFSYDILYPTF